MSKAFYATLLIFSFTVNATESRICGTFELMPSCGQFSVLVPKLTTADNVSYWLRGLCEEDDFQCMIDKHRFLHYSLQSGDKLCFTGVADPDLRPGCTDFAWFYGEAVPQ